LSQVALINPETIDEFLEIAKNIQEAQSMIGLQQDVNVIQQGLTDSMDQSEILNKFESISDQLQTLIVTQTGVPPPNAPPQVVNQNDVLYPKNLNGERRAQAAMNRFPPMTEPPWTSQS